MKRSLLLIGFLFLVGCRSSGFTTTALPCEDSTFRAMHARGFENLAVEDRQVYQRKVNDCVEYRSKSRSETSFIFGVLAGAVATVLILILIVTNTKFG